MTVILSLRPTAGSAVLRLNTPTPPPSTQFCHGRTPPIPCGVRPRHDPLQSPLSSFVSAQHHAVPHMTSWLLTVWRGCCAWRRCVRLRACWRGCAAGWGGATLAVACMVRGGVSRVRGRAMWCGPTCVNARVRVCVCDHPSLLRAPRAPCFCSAVLAVVVAGAAVALGCMQMWAVARDAAGGGAMQGGLSSAPRRSGVRSDRASRVRMRVVGRGARRGGRRDASWARMQAGGV
jgi:hypothetical protein